MEIRSFRWSFIMLAIAALALAASAQANTTPSQPVIGYAYSVTGNQDGCVKVGQPMQTIAVMQNMTDQTKTVVAWLYGIGKADPTQMKGGPLLDVDTTRSGLNPSVDSTTWYWLVTLKPHQSVAKTLYVNNVPPGYYPTNWNSAYGSAPWPTLYVGGQGYVKHSRVQFSLNAQVAYCSLDGSIPYTIPSGP